MKGKGGKQASKQKRWFVNASGWGLDFTAASDVKSVGTAKGKRSLQAPGDSQLSAGVANLGGAGLLNDTLYTLNPIAQIAQGTTEASRLGSRIFLRDLILRGVVSNDAATNLSNYRVFRIMLVVSTKQTNPSGFGTGLGYSDLFYAGTTPCAYALPNPRVVKVLCDEIISVTPTVALAATSVPYYVTCSVNQYFEYQTGTSFGTASNIYWVITPYEVGLASGVANMGAVISQYATVFENDA